MTRRPREDDEDVWHHVMNRGVGKRVVFEDRREVRAFLSLLAWEVRAGRVEIHAYCILPNHYHLLVRSPIGLLSEVMHWVGLRYVRWYNRKHGRDGPLFRGRFRSKPVKCRFYREYLVRYIGQNPVAAGMCRHPAEYPYSSARAWIDGRRPPWLATDWIQAALHPLEASGWSREQAYAKVYAVELSEAQLRWLERAQAAPAPLREDLALFRSAPAEVRAWMLERARLADGTKPGAPLVDEATVELAIAAHRVELDALRLQVSPRTAAVEVVRAGLRLHLCGISFREAAKVFGVARSTVHRRCEIHLEEAQQNMRYADIAARVAHKALQTLPNGSWNHSVRSAHRDARSALLKHWGP